jgi:light-regulated signal transduction histidine kinase (bacteriophytochrome)
MKLSKSSTTFFQKTTLILVTSTIAGLIFMADLYTGSEVAIASMYAVVILYSWVLPGRYSSIYAALACSVLTVISAFQNPVSDGVPEQLYALNWVISLVVIWTCLTLVFIAKSSFANLEEINRRLAVSSAALLEKVKELDTQKLELSENKRKLEALNADLIVKNRELERFTSIASHDLQEPLRTIGNMTQLISRKYYESFDDHGKKILEYVTTAATRMTALVKGLLEFSRIGSKRFVQKVNLEELVQNIVLDFEVVIKAAEAKLVAESLPSIQGNPVELRMLFQNLIGNALKFRKEGLQPIVEISAVDRGELVEFCVRDNGIGIDPSDYEKVFFIFQRLNSNEKYEGSGLGLAYCRKIVELHGGKIWIDSTKGMGSSFYFTLKKSYDRET